MQNGRILSAALALTMVCAIPGAQQAFDLGGAAFAAKAERGNTERRKARKKNRNGKQTAARTRNRNRPDIAKDIADSQTRSERRAARRDAEPRRDRRFARNRFRDDFRRFRPRDDFRRLRPRRFGRRFRHDRFCMRPRRIERRLFRRGWDVYSFRRTGGNFNVSARNRDGHRHSLTVDGCNGHVIAARNIEPRKKSKLKRTLRKIRRTFRKIF